MKEEWRNVVGYDGKYIVSSNGNVRSLIALKSKGIPVDRKIQTDKDGYSVVSVQFNKKNKVLKIHRIVAEAFIPNPENEATVNHINEIKDDNRVANLEWCSFRDNSRHSFCRKIEQCDLEWNTIKVWDAMRDAEREGYHRRHISECCHGKNKTHAGYKWRYYEYSKV